MEKLSTLLPNKNILIYTTLTSGITIFVWEHVARKRNSNIKPSVGFNFVAEISKKCFKTFGNLGAKISSFYTYIDLSQSPFGGFHFVRLCFA
jgi:hypothetical protein